MALDQFNTPLVDNFLNSCLLFPWKDLLSGHVIWVCTQDKKDNPLKIAHLRHSRFTSLAQFAKPTTKQAVLSIRTTAVLFNAVKNKRAFSSPFSSFSFFYFHHSRVMSQKVVDTHFHILYSNPRFSLSCAFSCVSYTKLDFLQRSPLQHSSRATMNLETSPLGLFHFLPGGDAGELFLCVAFSFRRNNATKKPFVWSSCGVDRMHFSAA